MKTVNCLFCRIIEGEIPSAKVYEDEFVFAFRDINPLAPTHVLIVPKTHYDSVLDAPPETIGHMTEAAKLIAKAEGVDEKGFRLVMNTGADAGQTVKHLHMHLLGGRELPM
ncbi:MAG: histidine triad nucleotide-binding protein [Clostridia bacterium]|jgi:histidine triad (HIT) family protein|nr:histidine triad nucleotide-binding protein [Clostridia bacterium]MBR4658189.1 histidine triad nucleotide-binding protein [Clostridia bacterium]